MSDGGYWTRYLRRTGLPFMVGRIALLGWVLEIKTGIALWRAVRRAKVEWPSRYRMDWDELTVPDQKDIAKMACGWTRLDMASLHQEAEEQAERMEARSAKFSVVLSQEERLRYKLMRFEEMIFETMTHKPCRRNRAAYINRALNRFAPSVARKLTDGEATSG